MNRDKLYILVRLIMINNKRLIAWKKQILAFAALSAMATAVLTEAILCAALSSTCEIQNAQRNNCLWSQKQTLPQFHKSPRTSEPTSQDYEVIPNAWGRQSSSHLRTPTVYCTMQTCTLTELPGYWWALH